jgi:lysylphosphatidylglycerol synthetase-like protein (DUF2156 family)
MTVLSLLIAAIFTVRYTIKRESEDAENNESGKDSTSPAVAANATDANASGIATSATDTGATTGAAADAVTAEHAGEEKVIKRPILLIASIVFAILAAVLFLLTQDMCTKVVLFDWLSLVFLIIAVITTVLSSLTVSKSNKPQRVL